MSNGTESGLTYSLLEKGNLFVGQGISLGNDGNQVDLGVQAAHHLNVQRLEGVASRLDKVDTCMHTVVHNVHPVDLVLGIKVCVEARLNVLNDWAPGVVIVYKVSEAGSVDHGQSQTHSALLDIGTDGLDGHRLWDNLKTRALALLWGIQRAIEQGVDECGLAETGFTCNAS